MSPTAYGKAAAAVGPMVVAPLNDACPATFTIEKDCCAIRNRCGSVSSRYTPAAGPGNRSGGSAAKGKNSHPDHSPTLTRWQIAGDSRPEARRQALSSVTGWRGSGFRPLHESLDNGKNREHHDQIRRVNGGNQECGNPLGGPGNKQNQRDVKSRKDSHGAPKPSMSPQFPSHCDGNGDHRNREESRTRQVKSPEIYKQEAQYESADYDAQDPPPR